MKCFDVNILIYAHREEYEYHAFYRDYVNTASATSEFIGLSPLTAAGFVRIVTNPRYPYGPTPLPQALAVIDSFTSLENFTWIQPGQRHWQITANLCRETNGTGKHVADAQHAAIAIEHAFTWVTRDSDFLMFKPHGLKLEILEP